MTRWMPWACAGMLCAALLSGDDAAPAGRPAPPVARRPLRADDAPVVDAVPGAADSGEAAPGGPIVRRLSSRAPLEGKIVSITLRSDPEYGSYLKDVQVQSLGRGTFLVGVGVETGFDDWTDNRRTWISVDDISQIIEFDTLDELKQVLKPLTIDPDA